MSINYEKLNNLIFNVFETNIENDTNLPNNAYDPDINCEMYRSIANDMSNVCDYYTEDNFVKAAKQFNPSDLSMFHFNVRSLPAHIDELSPFLKNLGNNFKFIGLCETWLNEFNHELYNIEGYSSVHNVRSKRRGGGVTLFIEQNIK